MVRTKADSGSVKAAGAKAPRKITNVPTCSYASAGSSDNGKGKQNTGGNSYCPRETPAWQKEITSFFKTTTVDLAQESKSSTDKICGDNAKEAKVKDSSMVDASG